MSVQSKTIKVLGHKLHYLEDGTGDPILMLHGIPASSYSWRKVIPKLSEYGRCLAPDMIGMGRSEKPDIEYRIFDHIRYIEAFITKLDLRNITLLVQGWGSVIGFDIASRHPERFKNLIFFESHIRPVTSWEMLSLPVQQLAVLLKTKSAKKAVLERNYFIKKLLPKLTMSDYTTEDLEAYAAPFDTPESRKPLWQYLNELPLGNGPEDVLELIRHYSQWLQATDKPMLMLYTMPGFITTMDTVLWAKENLADITIVEIGHGLHFPQEFIPNEFSVAIIDWLQQLK